MADRPVIRPCPTCGAEKERSASGRLVCRPCDRRRSAEWARDNLERSRAIKARHRRANTAKAAEWRAANRERLLAQKREHYRNNRERYRELNAARYAANREAYAEANRAWTADNREHVSEYKREWYLARRDELRAGARANYAANRERIRDRYRTNPDLARAANQRRRARELAAVCAHGPACVDASVLAAIRAEPTCLYCDAAATQADHFVPLTRGGMHCRDNLVPCCQRCNSTKNNRDPDEWLAEVCEKEAS